MSSLWSQDLRYLNFWDSWNMNIVKFCTKPMNLWPRMLAQLPRHACLRSLVATSGCNRKAMSCFKLNVKTPLNIQKRINIELYPCSIFDNGWQLLWILLLLKLACDITSQQDKGLSSFRTNAVDLRLKVWNWGGIHCARVFPLAWLPVSREGLGRVATR